MVVYADRCGSRWELHHYELCASVSNQRTKPRFPGSNTDIVSRHVLFHFVHGFLDVVVVQIAVVLDAVVIHSVPHAEGSEEIALPILPEFDGVRISLVHEQQMRKGRPVNPDQNVGLPEEPQLFPEGHGFEPDQLHRRHALDRFQLPPQFFENRLVEPAGDALRVAPGMGNEGLPIDDHDAPRDHPVGGGGGGAGAAGGRRRRQAVPAKEKVGKGPPDAIGAAGRRQQAVPVQDEFGKGPAHAPGRAHLGIPVVE